MRICPPTAGLHPPLLVTCVRASQKALFHRRTIVLQSRAGGVSPPWNVPSARELEAPKFVALELQTGFTNPRRAHARRSWYCAFVHRKHRFFRQQTSAHQHKSGGRQPPVALINANATAIRTHTVGGLPTNGACVCRCAFAHPRRAYARRSWYCASVHRKHRFFAGRHSHANTRAGGVSPPWPAIVRDRTNRRNTSAAGNRIRTSDQLRGASAPRGANKRECNGNPHTLRRRSADEWRSCLPMRICPPTAGLRPPLSVVLTTAAEHYGILLAQRASCEPRRADARRSW
jgi:hypothetical protein